RRAAATRGRPSGVLGRARACAPRSRHPCEPTWRSASYADSGRVRVVDAVSRTGRRACSASLSGAVGGGRVPWPRSSILAVMRISIAADERVGIAGELETQLRERGHEVLPHGALAKDERREWAWASEAVARDVAEGRAQQGVVCCWTGTGASIAA